MNTNEFWGLIERARQQPAGVVAQLFSHEPPEIVAFHRHLRRVLAASLTADLWGAAYLINGGCSDEKFDTFRGWLMTQGREAFARAVAEPDTLADNRAVRRVAVTGEELGSPDMLRAAADAYLAVTGAELPVEPDGTRKANTDDFWDFDDEEQVAERLPRLAVLFNEAPAE